MVRSRHPSPLRRGQRGMVLFIALIVMVALSLAGVALIRSVDTTTSVIGNLAFRQSAIVTANWAVENATASIFADANKLGSAGVQVKDTTKNLTTQSYYATLQGGEDKRGVPAVLQKKSAYTSGGLPVWVSDDGAKNQVRYVVERMCREERLAGPDHCDMMPPKQGMGTTINDIAPPDLGTVPFYRVTVRVDGPQNTVSFVQTMLR